MSCLFVVTFPRASPHRWLDHSKHIAICPSSYLASRSLLLAEEFYSTCGSLLT